MKKVIFITFMLMLVLTAWGQKKGHHVLVPGNGKLDLEQFIRPVDTNMDISNLSLSELRLLRNGLAARQGYIFMDAGLRSIFRQTSWYDSIMWAKFEKTEDTPGYGYSVEHGFRQLPLNYSKAELAFIEKIKNRERMLQETKYNPKKGYLVDTDKLLNPFQLETFDPALKDKLGRNGFAIVPGNKIQLFHVYEKNDYSDFPSFVTTDLYLQLFHFYFDSVLRNIEEERLSGQVEKLCKIMYEAVTEKAKTTTDKNLLAAYQYNQAYFAIANALITGKQPLPVAADYQKMVEDEIRKVNASEDDFSPFMGYLDVKYNYSLFRPRGHYSRNENIKKYFRAMMWLQNVHFGTDKPNQLTAAVTMAETIATNAKAQKAYEYVFKPMTFLFGKPDNITIFQVYDEIKKAGMPTDKLLKNKKALAQLRKNIEATGEQQTRIRPKFELTSHCKIDFMPQRYMPDSEVLNEMIDAKNEVTKRGVPCGLDVFAALGNTAAERILLGDMQVQKQWEEYIPTLTQMKQRMSGIDWNETVATRWINSLKELSDTTSSMPYFMKTPQWGKKNLNTALASWAELKHDAILYAKQPAGAECGGYGPPEPVLKGYVEPNVTFWKRAIQLCYTIEEVLKQYDLVTEKVTTTTESLAEQAQFLLQISTKELKGQLLSEEEYRQIEIIGSTFEYISLELARDKEEFLQGWDDVHGADRSVAVVADVYTANALNNPKHSILYEATGPAYEIYVVVEIEGNLYLTRGAVLSYREFERPTGDQRLTDEEWQKYLKDHPSYGIPSWMEEISVPVTKELEDNEEFFYSSGC